MRHKMTNSFVLIFLSQYSFAQNDKTITVFMETLQVNEIFEKVGDTLIIKGIDYGKDSIETVKFILKDNFGSYEAILTYRSSTEVHQLCYQGDKKSFELISISVYNEKGEITGKKEMKAWKPSQLDKCH